MQVLGIDYSLNGTGLSIYNGDEIISKKVFTITKKNSDTDKNIFILSPSFKNSDQKIDWVVETIMNNVDCDFVCLEDHIGKYYNWMDGYALIKHYLRLKNIPYICVAPAQLKKFAGSGKADKTQMSYFLRTEYNIDLDYLGDCANNIVDATWLAILGYNYHKKYIQGKKIKLNDQRTEILDKLFKKG